MNYKDELRTRHMMQFLGWLQNFDPQMHALVIERIGEAPPANGLAKTAAALNGIGQFDFEALFPGEDAAATGGSTSSTGGKEWWEAGADIVKSVAQGALQYKTQKDLIDLQMSRIEKGLPPIDTALISPTVRVQADLPAGIQQDIRDMKRGTLIAIGAVVLGAFAFFFMKKR